MLLNKKTVACVTGLLLCSYWAESAQTYCPPVGCPGGPDGGCTPRRITYGYYPTLWRRWPNEGPTTAKPQPEKVPTPAKREPLPKVEADVPVAPSEELPLFPTDSDSVTPEKSLESSLVPPFDDSAPEPPSENSGEMVAPGSEPGLPGPSEDLPPGPGKVEMPVPATDDLPPSMPAEDPFKDEPEPNKTSAVSASHSERSQSPSRELSTSGRQWRATRLSAAAVETPMIKQVPMGEEPSLVPPTDDQAVATPRDVQFNNSQGKQNPLRTSTVASLREQRVVPTASWSSEPPKTSEPSIDWRRNPLRAN